MITGNPVWAQNTAAASVGLALFTPSININPPAITLVKAESFSFDAIVRGSTSDVVWEVSDGSINTNGKTVEFTPPGVGTFTLTASLASDPSYTATATIIVAEPVNANGSYKIDLSWGSSRYGGAHDAHLWLPNNRGCHISPLNRGSATTMPYATFDQDGSTPNPYGPGGGDSEIITIHKRLSNGQYEYAVERNGNNHPQVTVTLPNGRTETFYLNPAGRIGRWWHVFSIDAVSGNLIEVDEISDSYAPYSETNNSGCNP